MKWTARSNDGETTLAAARRALRGANNVLRTRYPLFLLGLPVARSDEFLSAATRKGARGDKRVLLTFDDARRSFYEVALPTVGSEAFFNLSDWASQLHGAAPATGS